MKDFSKLNIVIARSLGSKKSVTLKSTKQPRCFSLRIYLQEIVLSIFVLCISCTVQDLPISVDPAEPQIAVSSLVGPSETFFVTMSRSFSALSAEDTDDLTQDFIDRLLIDSALVVLEYEGITDTLEAIGGIPGLFGTQLQTFIDFQVLSLTAFDSTSGERVSAESVLLPAVEMDSISITKNDTLFEDLINFYYRVPDREEENFYVVQAYQLTSGDTTQVDSSDSGNLFFSDQNFLIYEQLLTDRGSEDGFIEKNEIIEFTSSTDSALVVITNISEGYYNFLEARQRSGGFISSLANEPVNHPSNIENGVGYFSAHQPRAVLVLVREDD